jgi:hypothetical protein
MTESSYSEPDRTSRIVATRSDSTSRSGVRNQREFEAGLRLGPGDGRAPPGTRHRGLALAQASEGAQQRVGSYGLAIVGN